MKLYFSDQSPHFQKHLQYLQQQPSLLSGKAGLIEKRSNIIIHTTKSLKTLDTSVLFNYRIFPPHIMSAYTQWRAENRQMQSGDTIVQQVCIPPFKAFSQKILFGVRINQVIAEPTRIGFSYETLQGHVEKGISTFTLEQTKDNQIIFSIHTFSQPGNWFTKLLGPIFSIPYQTYCTRQALKHVKAYLEA